MGDVHRGIRMSSGMKRLPILSAYRRARRTDIAGRWTYLYRAIDQHGQVVGYDCSYRWAPTITAFLRPD